MDRETWRAAARRVAKSQTRLQWLSMHARLMKERVSTTCGSVSGFHHLMGLPSMGSPASGSTGLLGHQASSSLGPMKPFPGHAHHISLLFAGRKRDVVSVGSLWR